MHKSRFVSYICTMLTLMALMINESTGAGAIALEPPPPQPTGVWATIRAYDLRVAYWTGIEPHYGAFFSGSYGRDQHYLGPGGDPATCGSSSGCISAWNWWGTWYSVLLVPKGGWLWTELPSGPKWQPSNYQATLWIG